MLINFIMLITYANQLRKLMSGQIDKMSDQKDTCPVKEEKLFPALNHTLPKDLTRDC